MIMKKNKILTPGNILRIIINQLNVTEDELVNYALVSKKELHSIFYNNHLVPISIGLYLESKSGITIKFWQIINDNYINNKKVKLQQYYQIKQNKCIKKLKTMK